MSLLSKKYQVAECSIYLFLKKEKNIADILVKEMSISNGKNDRLFQIIEKSKLPIILFMFYFDKVLFNSSKKLSEGIIEHFQRLTNHYINELRKNNTEENWVQILSRLKSPNNWIFARVGEGKEKIVDMELFIRDNGQFFIQTYFPRGIDNIELKSFFTLEAFFQKTIEETDYMNAIYYFIPLMAAQCYFYKNKRPDLRNLGIAPQYALIEVAQLLEEHGLTEDI